MRRSGLVLSGLLSVLVVGSSHAQNFTTSACTGDEGNSHNNGWFGGQSTVCEMRSTTLPLVNGVVRVIGKNGGIEVVGEDRQDVALEARVVAKAGSQADAEAIERAVRIRTDGTIQADGPTTTGMSHKSWYVNYRLRVPRQLGQVSLVTQNGGIDLSRISGSIQAETTNGGITLTQLAGDVHATTVNGGVEVTLVGERWEGAGLDARSTNGGVDVKAPEGYSAHLVASTTNGGVSVGFPVTIQGTVRNRIDTQLGKGGPTLQFETVNGGVSIDRD